MQRLWAEALNLKRRRMQSVVNRTIHCYDLRPSNWTLYQLDNAIEVQRR